MADIHLPKFAAAILATAPVLFCTPLSAAVAAPQDNGPVPEQAAARGTARSDSGIAGQVEIRPIRPHVTIGQPETQPYQTKIDVVDAGGHAVTTVESDASGNFRVTLPPGKYTLRPQSPGLYPRASQQTVVVAPRRFTQVHVTYDSGIR